MKYNETPDVGKNQNKISATIEQIKEYTEQVIKGLIVCTLSACPRCELESQYFKRHEARQRIFYPILDQIVYTVTGLVIRWKCTGCSKSFTQYPDFALPYKRYTLPTIELFSQRYTEDDSMTYRKAKMKTLLGHKDSEKQMEHTTIYHWITTLGKCRKVAAKAIDLILQVKPLSTICRDLASLWISPKKYRSEQRKEILIECRKLFRLEVLYRLIFKISIFPKFATNCRLI